MPKPGPPALVVYPPLQNDRYTIAMRGLQMPRLLALSDFSACSRTSALEVLADDQGPRAVLPLLSLAMFLPRQPGRQEVHNEAKHEDRKRGHEAKVQARRDTNEK